MNIILIAGLYPHGCLKYCHFKRTQYWKHSSVKQPRNAVEPSKWNKYVALNCQTHEALIFKPFFPTKEPETCFSSREGPTYYQAHVLNLECLCVCACTRVCVCCVYQGGVPLDTQHCREWSYTVCATHKMTPFLIPALSSWQTTFGTLFCV